MTDFDPRAVPAALDRVLPAEDFTPLHEPHFGGREQEYVASCIETGWVSSAGAFVDRFEKELAAVCGVPHAVACASGTAALHVSLRLVGVERDDEVLTPALTFVATANAVAYCGAVPHFVDSEERTLGLDPARLGEYLEEIAERRPGEPPIHRRTGRRLVAVMPMHTFGHPVDMDPLLELAQDWGLAVVEDAAEAIGSRYKGRPAGGLGQIGALSFNGNKILTTGGGGAILTRDEALARRARHLTTTAKVPHAWEFLHDEVGYNYRMPNLNAALGCGQLEQLGAFLAAKGRLAERYREVFAEVPGVTLFEPPAFADSNHWLNVLLLDEGLEEHRDPLLKLTNEAGRMTRPAWRLMPRLPMYRDCPAMPLPVAESLERRLINLPSSARLGEV